MSSDNPTTLVHPESLEEDPQPNESLGGDGSEADDATEDPTSSEEFDTSPEALEALLEAEAEADGNLAVESADLPKVRWAEDHAHPDFAHTQTAAAEGLALDTTFDFGWEVFDLLVRANQFRPRGKNDLVAFGLRGARLAGADRQEDVESVRIEDVRPDHEAFRCTIGILDMGSKRLRAYSGSTVPNRKWMRNYYKLKHGIRPHKKTQANLLPTGCYIYRVGAHGGGSIRPALRMTDPDDLTADAKCTVLRTSKDLTYSHDDLWDPSRPYDNIHCAYSNGSFSSAGCQTIKGVDGAGPWGAFQKVIGSLGRNARIDYVLLTGREASIAAAIIAAGRQDDAALVQACLGRLRVGSEGEVVTALQKKLGFNGSAYFGPSTKKRLTKAEKDANLASDGIYSPADDRARGWRVFPVHAPAPDRDGGRAPRPDKDTEKTDENPPRRSVDGLGLRLAGSPEGNGAWDDGGRRDQIRFRPSPDQQSMNFSAHCLMEVGETDVPIVVETSVHGLPPKNSGVTIEVAFASVRMSDHEPDTPPDPEAPHPNHKDGAREPGRRAPDTHGRMRASLTPETFDAFAPRARADYRAAVLDEGHRILGPHGIDATPRRLAHFFAQIRHESGGFTRRIESLNYTSARRLTEVWPSRFPTEASARPFVRNEPALAEKVYGGRLGNTSAGDGFRYRGRGLIQLTGRASYAEFSERVGVDLVSDPDRAFEPVTALKIAAAYWAGRKLKGERPMNALADDDKLRAITYRINGGFTNFEHREAELARAKTIWGDVDSGPHPQIAERGDFDDTVRRLQLLLLEIGALRGKVDGKFGFGTYKGLFSFKSRAGMDGAGYADSATFLALSAGDPTVDEAVEDMEDVPEIGHDPEQIRNGVALGVGEADLV